MGAPLEFVIGTPPSWRFINICLCFPRFSIKMPAVVWKSGKGEVIAGWDEGIMTMNVGGKRNLIVPPALGYGRKGSGNTIPPNATLHFECELVAIGNFTRMLLNFQ